MKSLHKRTDDGQQEIGRAHLNRRFRFVKNPCVEQCITKSKRRNIFFHKIVLGGSSGIVQDRTKQCNQQKNKVKYIFHIN